MKLLQSALTLGVIAVAMASGPALAGGHGGGHGHGHHHHAHGGGVVFVSTSPWWWYFPPTYYYYLPDPQYPTEYVERDSAESAPPDAGSQAYYSYYCPELGRSYPELRECPGGWQEFISRPAGQ